MFRQIPPLTLEDRTGHLTNSDFDDMYDRLFFHIARLPGQTTTKIYDMHIRASRNRSKRPITTNPIIHLEFLRDESLGTVSFFKAPYVASFPMGRYLKKTAFFGPSSSRKFTASDGREYRWGFRVTPGQEWSCTTPENVLVAHYDLNPPGVRTYDVTGNNLIIYQQFTHLAPELLASLIIMRHIVHYNL